MNNRITCNQIIKLGSVDSTNNYAAKLVRQTKTPFGSVIMADFQTNGKGQRANTWISYFQKLKPLLLHNHMGFSSKILC